MHIDQLVSRVFIVRSISKYNISQFLFWVSLVLHSTAENKVRARQINFQVIQITCLSVLNGDSFCIL